MEDMVVVMIYARIKMNAMTSCLGLYVTRTESDRALRIHDLKKKRRERGEL